MVHCTGLVVLVTDVASILSPPLAPDHSSQRHKGVVGRQYFNEPPSVQISFHKVLSAKFLYCITQSETYTVYFQYWNGVLFIMWRDKLSRLCQWSQKNSLFTTVRKAPIKDFRFSNGNGRQETGDLKLNIASQISAILMRG